MPSPSLAELIAGAAGAEGGLTPSERRLAAFVVDHPTALAFETVASIAHDVGVSGPTVIRFATKLGFDGYAALQQHVQSLIAGQLRRPSDRHREGRQGADVDGERSTAVTSVERAMASVTSDDIRALAAPLSAATGHVWITSSGTSSASATALANGLTALRPGVRHLTGSGAAISAELIAATSADVVIAIDMPRYERRVVDTARWLHDLGATVLAITDGALSPLVPLADVWVTVDVPAIGPFDSALPTVAVAELVVAELARQLGDAVIDRLDRAEALWALHGVFEDD